VNRINEDRSQAPSSEQVCQALRRCWQPVARVADLESGPQRSVLLGEGLAVFLTDSGEPAVVADRCAHRGASLSRGKIKGASLQCPYHGWEWAGKDGACTRIPSLNDQSQIPDRARIPAFPARVQWGLVWTVLEEPLTEIPKLPWFAEEAMAWRHGTPFELPVGFGLMIENFRDVAHFAFVHQATLGAIPEIVEPLEPERDGFEVMMRREMTLGAGGEELYGSLPELRYHTVAPNLTSALALTDKGERGLVHIARAIGPTESMHYWIHALGAGFEESELEESIEFESRVYAEDRQIVSTVQPPELCLDPDAEISTLADRYTVAYRQAFVDFVWAALALTA
jgi:phenylpropionate dioxygenase-like ring-hydroxylating dioxygenase large terminal subunit